MSKKDPAKPSLISQQLDDLKQAWNEICGQPAASVATVFAIASTLAVPILLILLSTGLGDALGQFSNNPTLTAYLKDADNSDNIDTVSERLLTRSDISFVEIITKSEALTELGELGGLGGLLDELESNPLPDALVITPLTTNYNQLEKLASELSNFAEIERVDADVEWLRSLQGFTGLVQTTGLALGAFTILGFFLVIGNSVKLTIQQSNDEIKVLKLIGAPDSFILQPLLYLGLLYGLFAAFAAVLIQWAILAAFSDQMTDFIGTYNNSITLNASFALSFTGFLTCLVGSAGLGVIASGYCAKQALKALEP